MKSYFKLTLSFLFCMALAIAVNAQQEQYGQASYYSDNYHGKKTASGQKYDKNKLTAAHNDFPFGSTIRVTHLGNKKSVTVKVIDRGPYIKGRIVDLSRAAASQIGLINDGVAQVKVELLKGNKNSDALTSKGSRKVPEEYSTASTRKKAESNIKKNSAAGGTSPKGAAKTKKKIAKANTKKKSEVKKAIAEDHLTSKGDAALPLFTSKDLSNSDVYQITLRKPVKEGYGVQVASLTDYENVLKQVANLQTKHFSNILIKTENAGGEKIYKIVLGQYETRDQANSYKKDLKRKKKINGFVIPLGEE